MIFLELEDLLHVARRTLGDVEVPDIGPPEPAAARPRSAAFGEDAHPSIHAKAAAPPHSIAETVSWPTATSSSPAAIIAFYRLNGLC